MMVTHSFSDFFFIISPLGEWPILLSLERQIHWQDGYNSGATYERQREDHCRIKGMGIIDKSGWPIIEVPNTYLDIDTPKPFQPLCWESLPEELPELPEELHPKQLNSKSGKQKKQPVEFWIAYAFIKVFKPIPSNRSLSQRRESRCWRRPGPKIFSWRPSP